MNLEVLFRLSAYGLIGSGFAALAVTGGLDGVSIVLYSLAFLGSWFANPRKLQARYPRGGTWAFEAYAIFYFLDLFFLSMDFLMATVHLVLFTSALKLFTIKSDRDYVFLFLISFTQLVAASTLTISLSFLVMLSLFLVAAVATLILFEICRSLAERQPAQSNRAFSSQTGYIQDLTRKFQVLSFFGTVLVLTFLILGLAVPIFFLLPRLQSSFLARNPAEDQLLSGFSDRIILGEIGSIKKNTSVVMRVKVEVPPGMPVGNIKWRGIALDKYDGKTWSQSVPQKIRLEKPEGRNYFELSREPYRGIQVVQTYFLQPISVDVLFVLNRPTALAQELPELQQSLLRDRMGSLSRERQVGSKLRYTVWSDVYLPPPEKLREAAVPLPTQSPTVSAYFEVPQLDARIAALAEGLTQDLSNSYDKARRIESYLKSNYSYSLNMTPNAGEDPLAAFLFESKQGHCEYFASAMAIMLRCLGIPTRLVNGFQTGEYNELGRDYIVRQSNAHSWVEVFFPGFAWVDFDPTPPEPLQSMPSWLAWMGKIYDAAELYWEEHFIRYNLWRQVQLFSDVRVMFLKVMGKITQWILKARTDIENRFIGWESTLHTVRNWRSLLWIPAMLTAGLLLILLRRRMRKMIWQLRGKKEKLQKALVLEFYGSMLDILKKRGHKKSPSCTAREFADSMRHTEFFACVSEITEIYYRLRFRGDAASEDCVRQIHQLLHQLRTRAAAPAPQKS